MNGVDYTFLTVEEFNQLRQSGDLLESGEYEGKAATALPARRRACICTQRRLQFAGSAGLAFTASSPPEFDVNHRFGGDARTLAV